tara:strand:+ start:2100 stop:3341 length:1242 start_codon:yes stop_codon:yes gene_type:complete
MAGENFKLRRQKGSQLTFLEMDDNLSQLIYSASVSGNNLTFFYTGSTSNSFLPRSTTVTFSGYTHPNHGGHITSVGDGITTIHQSAIDDQTSITNLENADELLIRNDDDSTLKKISVGSLKDFYTGSFLLNTTDTLDGDLTVTGHLSANTFSTVFVSSSTVFDSGSTKFGDSSDDQHDFTGSVNILGEIDVTGGSNKIRFYYDNFGSLPDANTYHGMFAHTHAEGKAWFAHGGNWIELATSQSLQDGYLKNTTDTLTGVLTVTNDVKTNSIFLDNKKVMNLQDSNKLIFASSSLVNHVVINNSDLDITGSATVRDNVTANNFITTSDKRLKSEITPIKEGLQILKSFNSYEYIKGEVKEAGFIAQEVSGSIKYAVYDGPGGYLTMNDRPILAHMHNAIIELDNRLKAIEKKLM